MDQGWSLAALMLIEKSTKARSCELHIDGFAELNLVEINKLKHWHVKDAFKR